MRELVFHFADRLALAVGPVLLTNYACAPGRLRQLTKGARAPEKLKAWQPICDADRLARALARHSRWFDALAGSHPRGIRDALEHDVSFVVVGQCQGTSPARLRVSLGPPKGASDSVELVARLPATVCGFCALCTGIHRSVGWGEGYDRHDSLLLADEDDDVAGFWPEI